MIITLLDFSSGLAEVQLGSEEPQVLSWPATERLVLEQPDETEVTLRRAYAGGQHVTTVGQLRHVTWGWWGW